MKNCLPIYLANDNIEKGGKTKVTGQRIQCRIVTPSLRNSCFFWQSEDLQSVETCSISEIYSKSKFLPDNLNCATQLMKQRKKYPSVLIDLLISVDLWQSGCWCWLSEAWSIAPPSDRCNCVGGIRREVAEWERGVVAACWTVFWVVQAPVL